jgi:hypothetical protein
MSVPTAAEVEALKVAWREAVDVYAATAIVTARQPTDRVAWAAVEAAYNAYDDARRTLVT